MAGSTFGTVFRVTTWGESHGKALGAVVDGCPAGVPLSEEDIQPYLNRRKPGQNRFTTARNEADQVEILSGVFEGKTTGTPISMVVFNHDQRSADYREIASYYRPGHADYTFDQKFGFRDYRGGGRSSGRETIGRVAAGALAAKVLDQFGISLLTYVSQIGPVSVDPSRFDEAFLPTSPLCMPDAAAQEAAGAYLQSCMEAQTSVGSTVECLVRGMPPGVGEPVFDKLDARLGQALFSIGAVKAVQIGDGVLLAAARGEESNDTFGPEGKASNHAGGIYGGISDGSEIRIRVSFKPTPSIARTQQVLCKDGTVRPRQIKGRHDPVIGPRGAVVVESMTAITLLDLLLLNTGSSLARLKQAYNRG